MKSGTPVIKRFIEEDEPDAMKEFETKLFDNGYNLKVKEGILDGYPKS